MSIYGITINFVHHDEPTKGLQISPPGSMIHHMSNTIHKTRNDDWRPRMPRNDFQKVEIDDAQEEFPEMTLLGFLLHGIRTYRKEQHRVRKVAE